MLALLASFASAQDPPTARPAPARLVGRFLLEGDRPAKGLVIELTGYTTRPRPGAPSEPWRSPAVRTDDDGRFELEVDAPPYTQFTLNVKTPGHVGATWRWNSMRPGETVDLGEFVLARGGAVAGVLVDSQRRPLRDAWTIYVDRVRQMYGSRGEPTRGQGAYDPASGRFFVEDLPPGPVRVQAYSRMGGWVEGPALDVVADEVIETELVFDGPDNTRRITLQVTTQPFYALANDIEGVALRGADKEPVRGRRDPRMPNSFTFDELDPGEYTLEIRDPRFRPWVRERVEPGSPVDARLVGASAIVLDVRDAKTKEPVTRYGLRTRFETSNLRGSTIDLFPPRTEAPEGGRLEGLVPLAQTLLVAAEGYAPASARIEDLPSSTTIDPATNEPVARVVVVELDRGATIEGLLVEHDGATPASFVHVELFSREDASAMAWSPWSDALVRKTLSDAGGRFRFEALGPGGYRVRAVRGLLESARKDVDVPETREADSLPVTAAFPARASLRARILAGDEIDLSGSLVFFAPIDDGHELRNRWNALLSSNELPAEFQLAGDGSFAFENVRAGTHQFELLLPQMIDPTNGLVLQRPRMQLGTLELPAGAELAHEFDLRDKGPGAVAFVLIVEGDAAGGLDLALTQRAQGLPAAVVRTRADGLVETGPMLAGEYGLSITSARSKWTWTAPEPVVVASGKLTAPTIELSVVAAPIELVHAEDGTPIAARRIHLLQAEPPASQPSARARTDANGRATLKLVTGRYRLVCEPETPRPGQDPEARFAPVDVEWTRSGPDPARVVLTPLEAPR